MVTIPSNVAQIDWDPSHSAGDASGRVTDFDTGFFVKLDVVAGQHYLLYASLHSSTGGDVDPYMAIYDSNGNNISLGEFSNGLSMNNYDLEQPTSGTVYVEIAEGSRHPADCDLFVSSTPLNDHFDEAGPYTGLGGERILGTPGNDTLSLGQALEVDGGSGDDTLNSNNLDSRMDGGAGDDTIHGGAGNNVAWGGMGDDIISGAVNATSNTFFGGPGSDDIFATGGVNEIHGGPDSDAIGAPGSAQTKLYGDDGNDRIFTGDLQTGCVIDGGAGSDDELSLSGSTAAITVVFGPTTMTNVEVLILAKSHDYSLTMADQTVAAGQRLKIDATHLSSTDSALIFDGSAETNGGYDIVTGGGASTFVLTGGLGADVFSFDGQTSADTINGGTGPSLDRLSFDTFITLAANDFVNVSHIEQIALANGSNSVTLTDALVSSADDGRVLSVIGNAGNDIIDASAVTTAANRVIFSPGSGVDTLTGGAGADSFDFAPADLTSSDSVNGGAGAALDRLVFTAAGTVAASAFQQVTHIEQIVLANGTNNVTLPDALVGSADDSHILFVTGGSGNDTVNAGALTSLDRAYITAGAGNDVLTGGLGLDIFYFAAAGLTAADTVNGGTGASVDVLDFTTAGTTAASAFQNVSHIEEVVLAAGTNNVALTDALVGSADDGHVLYAIGGTGSDTINAGAVTTATNRIDFVSGAGNDTLTGGAGGDIFFFTVADLTSGDSVNGGAGTSVDSILFTTAGTIAASAFTNVSHVEQIYLASGTNAVTLTNALVTSADDGHILHVTGGTGADTINAAAVTTATNRVVFIGGGGADTMTTGAGADIFAYLSASDSTSTGYDTITGFNYSADRFDIPGGAGTITLVEAARNGALDSGANFNTELAARFSTLAGHHAGLLTATSGTLSGQTFLVVDLNGATGYQAGSDLVIHLASTTGTLVVGDFI